MGKPQMGEPRMNADKRGSSLDVAYVAYAAYKNLCESPPICGSRVPSKRNLPPGFVSAANKVY